MSNFVKPGHILDEPRLAFENGGFHCPLDFGRLHEWWAVLAIEGMYCLLVPVSDKPVDDAKREGTILSTFPVLTSSGTRCWLCMAMPVVRHVFEVNPPGYVYQPSMTILPDSLQRALVKMPPWKSGVLNYTTNWHAIWYVKSKLMDCLCAKEVQKDWKTVTVADLLNALPDYDPPIAHSEKMAERIVRSIRSWLECFPKEMQAAYLF